MEINEDQILFCGHCNLEVGKLSEIIGNEIIATHSCFAMAENVNIDYATKKIYVAAATETDINRQNSSTSTHSLPGTSTSTTNRNSSNSLTDNETNITEGWTDNMVRLLICSYMEHKNKFDDPKFTKKKVWNIISQEMVGKGVDKSGVKCDEKWRNLKKTYDKIKCHLKTSGSDKIFWKFYDDFHNIYSKDPYFEPVAVANSSGMKRKAGEEGNTTVVRNLSPGENKRTKKQISPLEVENRKQKRHEEKMSLKREMFQWFKENHSKKE